MTKNSGFTLLETLLAIAIVSTALILMSQSWAGSFQRIRKTQVNFEVASLLERKMTEIELEYRGKKLEEIPEEKSEDFGDEYPQYSWSMKSKALEMPDISASMSSQDGGVDQMTQSVVKQLTEGLSKMVKEVTLTVTYKPQNVKNAKPQDFSVTTYFVDYDKEVSFGMPGI